jgi:hypothetical protein
VGNAPAVSVDAVVATPVAAVPYLNHAMFSGVPEDSTFASNWAASTQPWVFQSPTSLQGLVLELGPDNWQSRLQSLGATSTEPIWTACAAHFNPLGALDGTTGNRSPVRVTKPDAVYVGRRTRAELSTNTITFTNNTAGRVRVKINESRYLYADQTPAGALADVTIVADGVKTVSDLATELELALTAIAGFSDHFTAVAALGVVTVEAIVAGYPLIVSMMVSTPGPTMALADTTPFTPGDYADDLDDIQAAAEFGALVDPPRRRFYWCSDLQGSDAVNAEGMEWAEDQEDDNVPPRDYQFVSWSTSGARLITVSGQQVGNFNPTSTESAAQNGAEANGGFGWSRGSVHDHDRYEFLVPALLGRTIAYLPGQVSFTSKVLQGAVPAAQMSPRDFGDNETLTLADSRRFNWYSADGPGLNGQAKWGFLCDGHFMDQKWLEDYIEYTVRVSLLAFMEQRNIVTYTDDDIQAGKNVIERALASIPAVVADSIVVVSLSRDQVNPANIVARIYLDYTATGTSTGVINRFGTPSNPIAITITDG